MSNMLIINQRNVELQSEDDPFQYSFSPEFENIL